MSISPIKVLLVEDSPIALEILQRILQSSSEVTVVGVAHNGQEALELIPKLNPEVICTDFYMSKMDGLELTRQVMAKYPKPILVISNSVQTEDSQTIFKLLQAGAVDVLPKPTTGKASDYNLIKETLVTKIKVIAGVKVFTKPLRTPTIPPQTITLEPIKTNSTIKIVAIGSSTGGPIALQKVLSQLPKNFAVPIICTQHISKGFLSGLVSWLQSECNLQVTIATQGQSALPGTVYFAPDDKHLELNSVGKFVCTNSNHVDGHCPSVTVMFQSVARVYGQAALGILLTGMGKDGATGLKAIAQAEGITIAQDEKTSVIFGMPKEAIALGAARHILPIEEIAPLLVKKIGKVD